MNPAQATDERLPDRTRLGVVHLQVRDLRRSQAYYEEVIGLAALLVEPSRIALGARGGPAPLIVLHERRGARPVARHSRLGLYHFAILLPDRLSLGAFLSHLASLRVRAGSADHAVSEAVYLWDPDGLGIEVYVDRPREEWRRERGEIYMTTEPLDVEALVTAAAGQRWRGVPAATTIGHMHLHVGAIGEADRFYHQALGFDATVTTYPGALFMSAGAYHHHLGTNTWAGQAPAGAEDEARLIEWTLVLPTQVDVERVAKRMETHGHAITREGETWRVDDPWGTTLRVRGEAVPDL